MKLKKIYVVGALAVILASGTYKLIDSNNSKYATDNNKREYITDYDIEITNLNEDSKRGYFLTNKNGQTYGTYIDKDNGESLEPDLMLVEGTNGTNTVTGYVKRIELYDEENQPRNPEEAIEYMKKQEKKKLSGATIPIYTHDGKTVIGEF